MRELLITCRSLARRRAFTATAVATLAFGIGTTTAIFSLLDGVLLKPLPFPEADRLVAVYEANPGRRERTSLVAPARLADWARLSQSFQALSGSYAENVTDTSGAEPERLEGRRVMLRYFDVFGMPPLAGRTFTPDEERFGGATAAIVSEGWAVRRFGRAASAIGARLVIGGKAYTVVGVMPGAFTTAAIDVWLPAQLAPALLQIREARFLSGVGRIAPGFTIEQAQADLAHVQHALGDEYPRTDKDWSVSVADLKDRVVGSYRRALGLVFGAVTLLLLVAIANIAGLMLVQLRRRTRELGVRVALGASRAQLVATIAREAALIAAGGGAVGATLSVGLVRILAAAFGALPRAQSIAVDGRALAFVALFSVAATVLLGLWPAVHATDGRLLQLASETGRSNSAARHRVQDALAVGQIAVGFLLAAAAALLLRSYGNLTHQDVGFTPDRLVTFHVGAAWDEDRTRVGRTQETLVATIERLPGVVASGITNFLPATGATLRYQVVVEGAALSRGDRALTVGDRNVSAGYLKALGAPLVAGAWCPDFRFDPDAPLTAVVNRRFADEYGGPAAVVGHHLRFDQDPQPLAITGVIGNIAEDGPGAVVAPYVYGCKSAGTWPDPEYVVRTNGDPAALLASIRAAVHTVAPTRAVFGVTTVNRVMSASLEQPRLSARIVGLFAAVAVLLAALGLYGVLTLLVVERTRELGVRLALGARPASVVALVVGRAGRLAGLGLAAGAGLLAIAQPVLRALLFGVTPLDTSTLAAALLVLLTLALIAAAVPALRAAAIDPLEAIRSE